MPLCAGGAGSGVPLRGRDPDDDAGGALGASSALFGSGPGGAATLDQRAVCTTAGGTQQRAGKSARLSATALGRTHAISPVPPSPAGYQRRRAGTETGRAASEERPLLP